MSFSSDLDPADTVRVVAVPGEGEGEGDGDLDGRDEATGLMSRSDLARLMGPDDDTSTVRRTRMARGSSTEISTVVPVTRPTTQHTIPRASVAPRRRKASTTEVQAQAQAQVPRKLGDYRITGVIAAGQMGTVYRAVHPGMRAPVAIKVLHRKHATNTTLVARFFAESVALARVSDINVVRFFDFAYGRDGSAYLVTELLEGETLATRLTRERRLEIPAAIDIATQIAMGLAAAHAAGVVHRDLKPDNVFLCTDGTVKLLDFGVSKVAAQAPMHTLAGELLGTAAYMAPEQGRSASESDERSDLYSLGCILFEMLCGVVPYPGTLVDALVGHQTAQRPPARALNPEVTTALDGTLDRLLARDPARRFQRASEVIGILNAIETTVVRVRRARKVRPSTETLFRRRWLTWWPGRNSPEVRRAAVLAVTAIIAAMIFLVR